MNYDVGCAMDFRRFPLDNQVNLLEIIFNGHMRNWYGIIDEFEQVCRIKYESFSYTSDQMKLTWMDRNQSQVFLVGVIGWEAESKWKIRFKEGTKSSGSYELTQVQQHMPHKSKMFLINLQINPDIQLDQFNLKVELEESIGNYDLSYSGAL